MCSANEKHSTSRLGFYYSPDSDHYTQYDLQTWLPRLKALGAGWLTLRAPLSRAIPEQFIVGLMNAGIEPVLHFQTDSLSNVTTNSLSLLFQTYANWGLKYVVLFDRPNLQTSWSASDWAREDLVERFLDIFLPLAATAVSVGLTPVFPPLEPGGNYWDTAFLHAAVHAMQRRSPKNMMDAMAFSAYAWVGDHPLEWGAGGPERWPSAHPYSQSQEDQRGFYIFDWYQAILRAALHTPRPILLMGAGNRLQIPASDPNWDERVARHTQTNLEVVRLFLDLPDRPDIPGACTNPIPPEVLLCNFWLLSATPDSSCYQSAWFQSSGTCLPVVDALTQLQALHRAHHSKENPNSDAGPSLQTGASHQFPIAHYLLLPKPEWGSTEWHLDVARSYILKYHPTVGFSTAEAAHAAHVLVVGDPTIYPDEILDCLRQAGCYVERITGDGTLIATQLADR